VAFANPTYAGRTVATNAFHDILQEFGAEALETDMEREDEEHG
jgi:selenophosphate synthase